MDEELRRAKDTFSTLCQTFDSLEFHYEKNEEDLSIRCVAQGDDIPMELIIMVDTKRQLVLFISPLPCIFPEDRRLDAAVAINAINDRLVDGCFDYDIRSGKIFFRLTNSFIESSLSSEALNYMTFCTFETMDDYNDSLLMLAKGIISLEQFIEKI